MTCFNTRFFSLVGVDFCDLVLGCVWVFFVELFVSVWIVRGGECFRDLTGSAGLGVGAVLFGCGLGVLLFFVFLLIIGVVYFFLFSDASS